MGRFPTLLAFAVFLAMTKVSWGQELIQPPARSCGGAASKTRNQYPAGGMMMVLASIPGGLKGGFEFYLCPDSVDAGKEECLRKTPLQLGDGSGTRYDLSKVGETKKYEIPLILPDDVTCDACSIQWRVDVDDCGDNEGCTVKDETSCFDLSIRKATKTEKRFFGLVFKAARLIGKGIHHAIKRRRG